MTYRREVKIRFYFKVMLFIIVFYYFAHIVVGTWR